MKRREEKFQNFGISLFVHGAMKWRHSDIFQAEENFRFEIKGPVNSCGSGRVVSVVVVGDFKQSNQQRTNLREKNPQRQQGTQSNESETRGPVDLHQLVSRQPFELHNDVSDSYLIGDQLQRLGEIVQFGRVGHFVQVSICYLGLCLGFTLAFPLFVRSCKCPLVTLLF